MLVRVSPRTAALKAGTGIARRRVEDDRLLRGEGRFVADLRPEGCLHLEFARAIAAPARIAAIEVDRASALPDVMLVLTGIDTRDLGRASVNPLVPGLTLADWPVLADRTVGAVGQPVAAVVARTVEAARDGAEAIRIQLEANGPKIRPDAFTQHWSTGDVDAAFERAACIVDLEIVHARLAPMALEPRAALAEYDADADLLTVWLSTQTPHRARADLAAILQRPETGIRVVAPDVGGAFGGKASLYPEEAAVALAALRLHRPVAWTATRSDEFLAATHGRGSTTHGSLALAEDGTMLGLKASIASPLGHWMSYSAVVPARNAARILPGPYRVPAVALSANGRCDAHAPVGIYRGAGRPEAAMLMERLVETAARDLGMDPAELRRINMVRPADLPAALPAGGKLDSGDFPALLDDALRLAGYADARARIDMRRAKNEICGIGLALYVEPCGQGWESATLRHDGGGQFTLLTGSTAQGQGRETAFAQIAAEALDVPLEAITVRHGDTSVSPPGIGALASRSTAIGGSAIVRAAETLIASLGGRPASGWSSAPAGEAAIVYEAAGEAWSSGCCIAFVAIDRDTGALTVENVVWVDDAGTVINPMLVEGQLRGGLAQGLGEALMERIVYDADGQLLTGSLMDYAVPRARDIPPTVLASRSSPSPANLLGAKGVGEAGCIGIPAAIVNAAVDALARFGIRHLDMPLSAEKLWRVIDSGEKR